MQASCKQHINGSFPIHFVHVVYQIGGVFNNPPTSKHGGSSSSTLVMTTSPIGILLQKSVVHREPSKQAQEMQLFSRIPLRCVRFLYFCPPRISTRRHSSLECGKSLLLCNSVFIIYYAFRRGLKPLGYCLVRGLEGGG